MSLHRAAQKADFFALSEDQQERYAALILMAYTVKLPLRVEVVNGEIQLTFAPGLASAAYWLDRFNIQRQELDIPQEL